MLGLDYSPLLISLRATILATVATFFLGIAAACVVSGYQGRFKGLIDGVLTLPLVLPPTVVGYLLLVLFGKNGPFGKLLLAIGTTVIFSWPGTVIAAAVVAFPLMYRTVRSTFEQIDQNVLNAARTLGAAEWKIFWKITIPLSWPGIAAGTVLAFARALGDFGATLMIGGNIPGKTLTIPAAIFFAAESGEMGKALIWVILIFIISLIVMTLMNSWNDHQRKMIVHNGRK